MRRKLIVLVALVSAGALLYPSVAAFADGGGDSIDETSVVLSKHDGPNGRHAIINDNGEIALRFDSTENMTGVSPNGISHFDRVFDITYTGDRFARVYIEDENDALTFYRDDDPDDTLEGPGNSVNLTGNRTTVVVGVSIDTTGERTVDSIDEFTVNVTEPDAVTTATGTTTDDGSIESNANDDSQVRLQPQDEQPTDPVTTEQPTDPVTTEQPTETTPTTPGTDTPDDEGTSTPSPTPTPEPDTPSDITTTDGSENTTDQPAQDPAPAGDEPTGCELFGIEYGSFVVCWYWWLLAAGLGLAFVGYRIWRRGLMDGIFGAENERTQDDAYGGDDDD